MIKSRVEIKHFSIVGLMSSGWVRTQVRTHSDFCWTRTRTLTHWTRTLVQWTRTRTRTLVKWTRTHTWWTRTLVLWTRTRTRTLALWTRTHCRTHESGLTPTLVWRLFDLICLLKSWQIIGNIFLEFSSSKRFATLDRSHSENILQRFDVSQTFPTNHCACF